jgi:hypothetical protein
MMKDIYHEPLIARDKTGGNPEQKTRHLSTTLLPLQIGKDLSGLSPDFFLHSEGPGDSATAI